MSYQKGGDSYAPPTGAPPSWSQTEGKSQGYTAQPQPSYDQSQQSRGYPQQGYGNVPPPQSYGGYQQQGGFPQQGGYPQGGYQQGGYQQGGYYQQQGQQPMYVQQNRTSGGSEGCLMACLAALCVCCTLDMLF